MPIVRRLKPADVLHLNLCNLDPFTENYDMQFYMSYLMNWPSMCQCIEEHGQIVGYILGKVENNPAGSSLPPGTFPWHGHISALSIAPQYRRAGYGTKLVAMLEEACNRQSAWFIDLYVRSSNKAAIDMYRRMGYSVYRTVVDYYYDGAEGGGTEDAFDMRKSLDRDNERKHVRENGEEYRVSPEEVY